MYFCAFFFCVINFSCSKEFKNSIKNEICWIFSLDHHLVCHTYKESPKIDVTTNYDVIWILRLLVCHQHVVNMLSRGWFGEYYFPVCEEAEDLELIGIHVVKQTNGSRSWWNQSQNRIWWILFTAWCKWCDKVKPSMLIFLSWLQLVLMVQMQWWHLFRLLLGQGILHWWGKLA